MFRQSRFFSIWSTGAYTKLPNTAWCHHRP